MEDTNYDGVPYSEDDLKVVREAGDGCGVNRRGMHVTDMNGNEAQPGRCVRGKIAKGE